MWCKVGTAAATGAFTALIAGTASDIVSSKIKAGPISGGGVGLSWRILGAAGSTTIVSALASFPAACSGATRVGLSSGRGGLVA